jgi:Protein of unknown function (DUF3048) N-terminal domain/Protein of unknown function (DUF3048) C-terminal domain
MNSKPTLFRRSVAVFAALTAVTLIGVSVFVPHLANISPLHFLKHAPENSISGRTGGDGPVLVVKIDDTAQAHPQIGLEDADIVYIEQVEGGLTRLAAVFSSKIPQKIGPVRSARISDIELFAQYGHVGFAYSGVQKKMRPVINEANLEDLGAQSHSSTIYTNDLTRIPPYAMVLRADLLMQFVQEHNLKLDKSKSMGWSFGRAPSGGVEISSVHLSWPANSYDAYWSEGDGRWLLDHAHLPDLAASGVRLGPSTLIIQNVSITDSIYKDKVGGVTPFSATIGTGTGYILRDGRYFQARWSRPDALSGTTWKTMDGNEITFPRGQIWVALTDRAPIFQPPLADATSDKAK